MGKLNWFQECWWHWRVHHQNGDNDCLSHNFLARSASIKWVCREAWILLFINILFIHIFWELLLKMQKRYTTTLKHTYSHAQQFHNIFFSSRITRPLLSKFELNSLLLKISFEEKFFSSPIIECYGPHNKEVTRWGCLELRLKTRLQLQTLFLSSLFCLQKCYIKKCMSKLEKHWGIKLGLKEADWSFSSP